MPPALITAAPARFLLKIWTRSRSRLRYWSSLFWPKQYFSAGLQQTQVQTNYLESATRAAQRQIESLRNSNFNNLTPGEDIDFSANLPDTLPSNSTGNVVVSEPSPGLRRVDVTVSYQYSGQVRDVELSSLIGVIGIVQ